MKRLSRYFFVLFQLVILTFGLLNVAIAAVTGVCSDCHTMHNSQSGTSVVTDGPYGSLLASSCIGCHSTTGTDPYDGTTPFVQGTYLTDTNCLAGGYFTTNTGDDHSDNSHTLGSLASPAGYTGTWYTGTSTGLKCAGSSGCHGYETEGDEVKAIAGGHHENDLKPLLGYRMLVVGSTLVGGIEAADYEEELITTGGTSGVHNVYCADTASTNATISELCGKCHGDFHSTAGTQNSDGAWIRHPSDVAIPSGWIISTSTLTGQDYVNNPVGYVDGVEAGTRYVTCLSCHRAHGTGYPDLLRWAYTTQVAGSGTTTYGCLGCHDKQR